MKFKKKPGVIEAFQMTKEARWDYKQWPTWLMEAWSKVWYEAGAMFPKERVYADNSGEVMIQTLEGQHLVSFDDWIIRGVQGELYPCKPDIFAQTYDAYEEGSYPSVGAYIDSQIVKSDLTLTGRYRFTAIFYVDAGKVVACVAPTLERGNLNTIAENKVCQDAYIAKDKP